jgi:gliding motility-associated lipoprotein GldH
MSTTILRILPAALLLALLTACGPGYTYKKTYELDPEQGWTYADTLAYDFEVPDSQRIYNLYLRLNHSTAFPYQNLYVRLHTTFPNGQRISEQVSLELGDKAGQWLGDCNSRRCELLIPIQQGAYFNQTGAYRLVVEQYMRADSLPGLEAVSFLLEQTADKRG